jgi:hypothetical protein
VSRFRVLVLTPGRLGVRFGSFFVLQGNGKVDLDATMATLAPEEDTAQRLILPSKERVMYRSPSGKSALGTKSMLFVLCSMRFLNVS